MSQLDPRWNVCGFRCWRYVDYGILLANPYNVFRHLLQEDPLLKDIKLMRSEDALQNVMRRFRKGD